MKKILLLSFFAILAIGCGSSNTVKNTYGTRKANKEIKGEWTLSTITYSQQGNFDVTLFSDTSKECFEGSTWKFVPNNYRGTYNINRGGCSVGQRNFVFVIQEVDADGSGYYDFLLKPTNEEYKSATNQGIRLHLSNLTDTEMMWEQTLRVDGKPFTIRMNFVK